jgi:hypothetical protein
MTAGTMGNGGWYQITGLGSGYAFAYNDASPSGTCTTGASTACSAPSNLCVSGSTGVNDGAPNYACWGSGFGVNVGQMMGSMTNTPIAATGKSGIAYSLSGFTSAPGGMRITLKEGGMSYCYNLTAASGQVPWSMFTQTCYNTPPGTALAGAPMALSDVEFTVESGAVGAAASDYNICVTNLAFY